MGFRWHRFLNEKILIILILSITNAFALDAVVTVLETPLLKSPSYSAPVVQYLRKGDIIKVHPSLNNNTEFDHLAPSPEKFAKLKKELDESSEWNQDPLFKGEATHAHIEDEFVPTLDRQGNTVYVIRDHLYVYFTSPKELHQPNFRNDPTDYRLEEPLPKRYPLDTEAGYRGIVTLGLTQPYYESYPYPSSVKARAILALLILISLIFVILPMTSKIDFIWEELLTFGHFLILILCSMEIPPRKKVLSWVLALL